MKINPLSFNSLPIPYQSKQRNNSSDTPTSRASNSLRSVWVQVSKSKPVSAPGSLISASQKCSEPIQKLTKCHNRLKYEKHRIVVTVSDSLAEYLDCAAMGRQRAGWMVFWPTLLHISTHSTSYLYSGYCTCSHAFKNHFITLINYSHSVIVRARQVSG